MDRPRAAFVLEEPDEERQADGKQGGQLTERMVAALDGGYDAFPKVVGISAHSRISSWAYPVVFYSVCHACVNRSNEKKTTIAKWAGYSSSQALAGARKTHRNHIE
jgi:hypothetical protein